MTRIVALALALVLAPAAKATEAADHNVTKHHVHRHHVHRHHAIVILLGKRSPPHTPPRPHEHHPLHGARPGEEQSAEVVPISSGRRA
jgi:hypothetical protein